MEWYSYALLSMLFFSIMVLIFKRLMSGGLQPGVILLFVFGLSALFYLAHFLIAKTPMETNYYILALLLIAAILSYVGNLFSLKAINSAPNVGYPLAINSLQIILVTVASVFLFGSKLSLIKVAGLLLGLIAIMLLAL